MEAMETDRSRPRQVRYQAALRPDSEPFDFTASSNRTPKISRGTPSHDRSKRAQFDKSATATAGEAVLELRLLIDRQSICSLDDSCDGGPEGPHYIPTPVRPGIRYLFEAGLKPDTPYVNVISQRVLIQEGATDNTRTMFGRDAADHRDRIRLCLA